MRRIMMVGDTHGNDSFFQEMCEVAEEAGCDTLLQLGDFGYWEHYPQGVQFLAWCNHALAEAGLEGYWLDGNHENHEKLRQDYGPSGHRYDPTPEGFWRIRENLAYLPRGVTWTWDDTRFLAVGGAYSIDKEFRTPGYSWWPEETLTEDDVELASSAGKVDVLVSHDAPSGADIPVLRRRPPIAAAEGNRKMLRRVVEAVKPNLLIHGHYHNRYTDFLTLKDGHQVRIEGLDCDMGAYNKAYIILETGRQESEDADGT